MQSGENSPPLCGPVTQRFKLKCTQRSPPIKPGNSTPLSAPQVAVASTRLVGEKRRAGDSVLDRGVCLSSVDGASPTKKRSLEADHRVVLPLRMLFWLKKIDKVPKVTLYSLPI